MEFTVQHRELPDLGPYTKITFQEGGKTLFELGSTLDSVQSWRAGFIRLSHEQPAMLESLLACIPKLPECHYGSEARTTFVNVVRALFEFLNQHLKQQEKESKPIPKRYAELYRLLRLFLFRFKADRQLLYLTVEIDLAGEELLGRTPQFPLEKFDEDPQGMWYAFLAKAYEKEQPGVIQLVQDYTHFRTNIEEAADDVTNQAFASLSKALVAFLESELPELRVYTSSIPEVCAFIVKNELESVEEQKTYLGKILASRESEQTKQKRLAEVVKDVKQDIQEHPAANGARLATIVGLISEHYLSLYDLDQSASFWNEVEKKDRLLKLLLSVHRFPLCYVVASAALFTLLTILSFLNVQQYVWLAPVKSWLPQAALVIMILVYAGIIGLILGVGYRLLWKKDLYYSQLFLPRLLGAVVVGLTALLVQDTPWRLGMASDPANWFLACLIAFALSFAYVFIEVYNTTKFLQTPRKERRARDHRAEPERRENIIRYAVQVSGRIFSIGLVEAFLAVLLTSTLFFPAVGLNLSRDFIGGITFPQGMGLSFGFFPALVVFWTGLALFIGAFVQLLWQDKRITASM